MPPDPLQAYLRTLRLALAHSGPALPPPLPVRTTAMAWNDTWEEDQRRKAAAEAHGGLVEHVPQRVVDGVLDDPLHCEDREFCEVPPFAICEGEHMRRPPPEGWPE